MRRTRILVVDDEPAIRKLLRANLEISGFDALAAGCVSGRKSRLLWSAPRMKNGIK